MGGACRTSPTSSGPSSTPWSRTSSRPCALAGHRRPPRRVRRAGRRAPRGQRPRRRRRPRRQARPRRDAAARRRRHRVTAAHPGWPLDLTWTTTARLRQAPSAGGVLVQPPARRPRAHRPRSPARPGRRRHRRRTRCARSAWRRSPSTGRRGGTARPCCSPRAGGGRCAAPDRRPRCWGWSRLHHTLVTGRVLSPCAAGEWAVDVAEPEWSRLLRESVRARHNPGDADALPQPAAAAPGRAALHRPADDRRRGGLRPRRGRAAGA